MISLSSDLRISDSCKKSGKVNSKSKSKSKKVRARVRVGSKSSNRFAPVINRPPRIFHYVDLISLLLSPIIISISIFLLAPLWECAAVE